MEGIRRLAVHESKQVGNKEGILDVGESRQGRHFGI